MRARPKAPVFLVLFAAPLWGSGCGKEPMAPDEHQSAQLLAPSPSPPPDTASRPMRVTSVELRGLPRYAEVGGRYLVDVAARAADGTLVTGRDVTWSSDDPSIASVTPAQEVGPDGGFAWVEVLGVGNVQLSAMVDGQTDSFDLVAIEGWPLSDRVRVESFRVIEYQVGARNDWWSYAPEVVLNAEMLAEILAIEFTLPGLGSTPRCWATRSLQFGAATRLFREIYGDFELTFDWPGRRATPGIATAVLDFVDAEGRPGRVLAEGPIEAGGYPATYTGGTITDPWECGWPYALRPLSVER